MKKTRIVTKSSPAAKKAAAQELQVSVDYPQQDEGITSREYTVRVGVTPAAEKVEVAIDRGPWLACRSAEGYWWYDWSGYGPGRHEAVARVRLPDGRTVESLPTPFRVAFEEQEDARHDGRLEMTR